jgi:hypothetical protein
MNPFGTERTIMKPFNPVVLSLCFSVAGWAWQGDPVVRSPQALDPVIQKIVGEISEARIVEILKKMESFGTRNTLSDPGRTDRGVGAARQWIFDQLKSFSPRLEVSFDTYNVPKGGRVFRDVEVRNVMAVLPGRLDRERWILIGGHYDSLNLRIPENLRSDPAQAVEVDAPGVTDNASGTACAMECARVMSQYEFDATLVFVAFVGEEQGLIGARNLARRLREKNQAVEAVLNNDIIGSDVSGNGIGDNHRILIFSEDPTDSPSRQIARYIRLMGIRYFPELTAEMVFRSDRFGRGGDHTPFNEQDYAAVRFTTPNENYSNQHSATDTFANTSPAYITRVTKLNAAAASAMALAPGPPVTVPEAQAGPAGRAGSRPGLTRGDGYDAVLRWDYPNPDPDLAGFIVVWRPTTAPDWDHEVWTGNVREFTLKNTPIDQLVFGVKAVDREGHESPVSAYTLPPRRNR